MVAEAVVFLALVQLIILNLHLFANYEPSLPGIRDRNPPDDLSQGLNQHNETYMGCEETSIVTLRAFGAPQASRPR